MQETLIAIARLVVAYTTMTITGTLGLLVRIVALGGLADFVRTRIVAPSSRLILAMIGVRLERPPDDAFPRGPVMYTFNHNSYLDVLIVTALGLRETRCVLSERTLKFVPVTISALAIGTLYIPVKRHAERRAHFFARTTARIVRERFAVIVSSEGVHEFVHGIAPFNDEVYRMAIEAALPIVPIYLHIPRAVNSLEGFTMRGGAVRAEVLPTIDTTAWRIDGLDAHIASMRAIFVRRFEEAHGESIDHRIESAAA